MPVPLDERRRGVSQVPKVFRDAVTQLATVPHRRGLKLGEVPAPRSAAPFAVALGAETRPEHSVRATGRFMLLHDPSAPEAWGGEFRIVTFVRAELDEAMGYDPLLSTVAWDWLTEALNEEDAAHGRLGGTATRILKESFGSLDDEAPVMDIELRASWTPRGSAAHHLRAWQAVLSAFAGLPPEIDGVSALPGLRYT